MQITVELHASFRIGRFKSQAISVPASATIGQIVLELGFLEKEIGIVLLNGRHASLGQLPQEGDVLSLLPRIGGG
jgi:molybdopterin synthase sulfur carrier subunit